MPNVNKQGNVVWPGTVITGGINARLTTKNGGTHRPAPAPAEVENGGIVTARTSKAVVGAAAAPVKPPRVISNAPSAKVNFTAAAKTPNTTTYVPSTTTAAGTRAFFKIKQPTSGNGT